MTTKAETNSNAANSNASANTTAATISRRFENYGGAINWFPGHMTKASKAMLEQMKSVDIILEVRDARIPFSSRNEFLEREIFKSKKHRRIILFNKSDLANHNLQQRISNYFEREYGIPCMFTTTTGTSHNKNLLKVVDFAISKFGLKKRFSVIPYFFMVVGVPNVGKSSIINALRSIYKQPGGKVAKEGPLPGVTRNLSTLPLCDDPSCSLVDTPGVMMPRVQDMETGLKLALTGAVKDEVVGEETLADFLLYTLNKFKTKQYVTYFGLKEPSENIDFVLNAIAQKIGAFLPDGKVDTLKAARHFLKVYRSGELGRYTLDEIPEVTTTNSNNIPPTSSQ
eukprot:GEZU01026673.1.p1 GENE.GEZU01026673.1~~GEZU01026673.1.p1  ORF type:complete len:387 (-),score=109.47 GEZU01026673.1:53-1072(-)